MKAMRMLLMCFLISSSLVLNSNALEVGTIIDGDKVVVPIEHLREALWYHEAYYIELELRKDLQGKLLEMEETVNHWHFRSKIYSTLSIILASGLATTIAVIAIRR